MRTLIILVSVSAYSTTSLAAVTEYTQVDAWRNAAGNYTTITFTELPVNTLVTTQYSHLGVTFTDNSDYIMFTESFVNDFYGLNGAFDSTTIAMSQPCYTIAVDYPGMVTILLYYQQELIYTSSDFHVIGGIGGFAGLVSDEPFDAVFMSDPTGGFFIDDLHFGPAIPAPGALGVLALAGAFTSRRKRRT